MKTKNYCLLIASMMLTAATSVMACTTLLVTRGASADGSVIIAHSDDNHLMDQRIIYVPAADHKHGSKSRLSRMVA